MLRNTERLFPCDYVYVLLPAMSVCVCVSLSLMCVIMYAFVTELLDSKTGCLTVQ